MDSYNFSGSTLVIMFLKCWDLENLKKFPRKHMKWRKTTVLSQDFSIIVTIKLIESLKLLINRLLIKKSVIG